MMKPTKHLPSCVLPFLLCGFHLAAQPTPERKLPQRVSGRVVSALDRHPLAHATVSLQQVNARQNVLSTVADSEGQYRFDAVPPGKYTLLGQASGYESADYLQHQQYGTAVVTGAGLDTDSLVLELTPLARIAGRILDEAGEPVAEASVGLYRESSGSSTDRITRFRSAQTRDNGEYEFARLPPGRYFLTAHATPWYAVHPQPRQNDANFPYSTHVDPRLDVVYPTVYYPQALDSAEATPFDLKGGEQVAANLEMQPVPAVSLSFNLPAGEPPNQRFPRLTQSVFGVEEQVLVQVYGVNGDQGVVGGLAPGQYHVHFVQPGQNRSPVSAGDVDLTAGSRSLDVSKPVATATVTFKVHGGDNSLPKGLEVTLRGEARNERSGDSVLDEKGNGTIPGLPPGDYRVQFLGAARPLHIVSLSVNGKLAPDRVLHVVGSGDLAVDVSVSAFSATIDGFALRDGKPDAGAMVELVPAGADLSESLFRRDQSDLDGSFTFTNVLPGKYLIVAIDDGWPLRWLDTVALAPYLMHALPVEVSATGPREIALGKPIAPQTR